MSQSVSEEVKKEFARILGRLMGENEIVSAADLARRVQKIMGKTVVRQTAHNWVTGRVLPGRSALAAMAQVFGTTVEALTVHTPSSTSVGGNRTDIKIDHATGMARIELSASMPTDQAMKILAILEAVKKGA